MEAGVEDQSISMISSQYNMVIFYDLCHVYPTDSDIVCRFVYSPFFMPLPSDHICLFKVAWTSTSEYIAIERNIKIDEDVHAPKYSATFKAENLPKTYEDLYQLCYISNDNVVGASSAFGFRKPDEKEMVSCEDPSDPDLVVFRSQFSFVQQRLDDTHNKCNWLTNENKKMNKQIEAYEADLTDSKATIARLMSQHNDEMRLKNSFMELETKFACNNDDLKREVHSLEMKLAALQNIDKEASNMNDTLQRQENDMESILLQLKEKDNQIKELQRFNHELQGKLCCDDKSRSRVYGQSGAGKDNEDDLNKAVALFTHVLTTNQKLAAYIASLHGEYGNAPPLMKEDKNQASTQTQNSDFEKFKKLEKCQNCETLEVQLMSLDEHYTKCEKKLKDMYDIYASAGPELVDWIIDYKRKSEQKIKDLENLVGKENNPEGELFNFIQSRFENAAELLSNGWIKPKDKSKCESFINQLLLEIDNLRIQIQNKNEQISKSATDNEELYANLKQRIIVLEYEASAMGKIKDNIESEYKKCLQDKENIKKELNEKIDDLTLINDFLKKAVKENKADNKDLLKEKLEAKILKITHEKEQNEKHLLAQINRLTIASHDKQCELNEISNDDLNAKFIKITQEKDKLLSELNALRAQMIGKININFTKELQDQIKYLKATVSELEDQNEILKIETGRI